MPECEIMNELQGFLSLSLKRGFGEATVNWAIGISSLIKLWSSVHTCWPIAFKTVFHFTFSNFAENLLSNKTTIIDIMLPKSWNSTEAIKLSNLGISYEKSIIYSKLINKLPRCILVHFSPINQGKSSMEAYEYSFPLK